MSPLHKAIAHLYEDGGSTEREAEFYPSDPRPARQTLQAQARGAAEPATKPKKHWDELKPSLKRQGWPKDGYQLLCANCNQGRARNGGVCPHGR